MATITSAGVGSGLDVNKIISELMTAERAPATQRLDRQEAQIQTRLSAFGAFKGAVAEFRNALSSVNGVTQFQSLSASISNEAVFSATTTSAAQAGSYNVEVKQLAQAQKLVTSAGQFTAVTDTVGTGQLTFQFGTTSGGAFTDNAAKPAKTITIDATNNTLAGLRDAINNANLGVRANIINDGNGYRLSLGAAETGAANSLKISVTDPDGNPLTASTGLGRLAYDPAAASGTGKNLTETVAAQNARLKVDGLDNITSASNSVVGVVQGVTLNLQAKSAPDTPATLTIVQDSAAVSKAVGDFVSAYNKLMETTASLTVYNAKTGERGPLLGNSVVRSVVNPVRGILTSAVAGATGALRALADVGISIQRNGSLGFNNDKLQAALAKDAQGVAGLFSRMGRTDDALVSYNSASSTSVAGSHAIDVTQIATQAQYVGHIPTAITIGAGNDTFSLSTEADGSNARAITLTRNTYATGAELAVEIQSQLDVQYGAGLVTAAFHDGRLEFTSTTGSLQFTAVGAETGRTLGFNVGAGSGGVYTGAAPTAILIGADNKSFSLSINGRAAGSPITLNEGVYTGAELAAELQRRVNANPALQSGGAALSISYQANAFSFTSNTYGSTSSIAFTGTGTSALATFGIGVNRVAGQDVAGTIGGVEATGFGQTLTGKGGADGIAVDVLGGATGARGMVYLSEGVAHRLDTLLDNFLSNNGSISGQTDVLNKQLENLNNQRERLSERMDKLEARYRAQFLAMDQLISQLTATGNFLTKQFFSNDKNNQ